MNRSGKKWVRCVNRVWAHWICKNLKNMMMVRAVLSNCNKFFKSVVFIRKLIEVFIKFYKN
jgi:hypothetical protein